MLFQCTDMYARPGHSNTKYSMKYNIFGLGSLRDTLQICKSKPQINHTIINNYHWFTDPTFCIQCIGIFQ